MNESERFLDQNLTEKAKEISKDLSNWRTDSPDRPPCAICGDIIDRGIPLRMWTENGEYEISFHFYCVLKDVQVVPSCEYCEHWDTGEDDWDADCKLNKFPHPDHYEDDWSPTPDTYCCDEFKDFRKKKES